MTDTRGERRRGLTLVEITAVAGTLSLLLTLGFTIYRGARAAAHVAEAENNLKQISTAMELYYRKYSCYPPQDSDLAEELGPFVEDPRVFNNPLMDEDGPGETLSVLYRAPTTDEIDEANNYLTAFVSHNGHTSVVLWTGQRIERHEDIPFNPKDPHDFHAPIEPPPGDGSDVPPDPDEPDPGDPDPDEPAEPTQAVGGSLNINPNNNDRFEFSMLTPSGVITRDDLHDSYGELVYTGSATQIRVCPKGNGNQNGLTLDGEPWHVRNGTLIIIASDDMWVHLRNEKKNGNGKAMGRWWIDIVANNATITTGL